MRQRYTYAKGGFHVLLHKKRNRRAHTGQGGGGKKQPEPAPMYDSYASQARKLSILYKEREMSSSAAGGKGAGDAAR